VYVHRLFFGAFFAEDWTLDRLLQMTEEAVSFAVGQGLPVMYVTEDTSRAKPETIRALYTTAIRCGAKAVCVCDTVGHSTPDGARAVVEFVKSIIEEQGGNIRLDWHGHQDRGLGVINSLAAIQVVQIRYTVQRSASASASATRRSISCS
jgi:2-isopropylmalate synthase